MEIDETIIKWDTDKDELYTYFGKCMCGYGSVVRGSNFCPECGRKIISPSDLTPAKAE